MFIFLTKLEKKWEKNFFLFLFLITINAVYIWKYHATFRY